MSVSTVDAIARLVVYLAVLVALALLARLLLARLKAARAAAERYSSERVAAERLATQQADVISSIITELASRPATYETFPPELREAVYAAHDSAAQHLAPRAHRKGNLS